MTRMLRFLAAIAASCCALLAFASPGSAQERLYGADGARGFPSKLYVLDPSTGAATQTVGPIFTGLAAGLAVTGLAEDPSTGVLYGVTGSNAGVASNLITINKNNGQSTLVGDEILDTSNGAADITFTPDATLYGWSEDTDDLVTINKSNGEATIVGPSGISSSGSGLASNAAGTLFLAPDGDNGDLFTVDRSTGVATPGPTMNGSGNQVPALAFDAAGTLFGVSLDNDPDNRPTQLITIDTTSGAVGVRGASVDRLDAIGFGHGPEHSVNLQKTKLKKGKKVRLSGLVDAPGNYAPCEAGQPVVLQRQKQNAANFATFRQLTTDNAGNFSTKAKVKKTTYKYRAVLPQTQVCAEATSNVQNVKAKKKKKKK
jgi:hypothetical protein